MKTDRINWKKIEVITYNLKGMSDDAKTEYAKAIEKLRWYDFRGEHAKAERIRKKLDERRNYKYC